MTKGAVVPKKGTAEKAILDFIKEAWEKNCFDSLLIPVEIPSGDSYAYLLIQDPSLIENASPLPPITSVQGARAISSITRKGEVTKRIAAIMRPCEIKAGMELHKLEQANLENVVLISVDCPGALPLSDYVPDSKTGKEEFLKILKEWGGESVRPVCKTCLHFGAELGDLHIAILGDENSIYLIPNSGKGKEMLRSLGISAEENLSGWDTKISEIKKKKEENKKKSEKQLESEVLGLDKLLETFSKCIGCHNCMRACPICYCASCYFDSDNTEHDGTDYVDRAENKGALKFPCDTLFFHLGRMSHMSLSCLGCGSCEDACPMSIPVAQLFSFVGQKNQELFGYLPGMDKEEKVPLVVYKEKEFEEFEDSH